MLGNVILESHDLDVNVDRLASKFADDTKIRGVTDKEEGCQKIQWDIDQLQK